MAVLAQSVGRMDILLHRGVCEKVGAEWKQRMPNEAGLVPVDMSGDEAVFEMLEEDDDVLYSQKCITTSNGCAYVSIPDSAFVADKWLSHTVGKWRITCVHNNKKTLLGWGNYLIV